MPDRLFLDHFERRRRFRGAGAAVRQLAFDLAAIFDRDVFVKDVAGDPRAGVDDQRLGLDRSVDEPRELRGLGRDRTLDLVRLALDEVRAFEVALDLAVDMQVDAGRDIAGDRDVRPYDREGDRTSTSLNSSH